MTDPLKDLTSEERTGLKLTVSAGSWTFNPEVVLRAVAQIERMEKVINSHGGYDCGTLHAEWVKTEAEKFTLRADLSRLHTLATALVEKLTHGTGYPDGITCAELEALLAALTEIKP